MFQIINGQPVAINWFHKQTVIDYAIALAAKHKETMVVCRVDGNMNYTVFHSKNKHLWDKPTVTLIFTT